MWPLHPAYAKLPADAEARKKGYPPLPLLEGDRIVDAEVTGAGTGVRGPGRLTDEDQRLR
jgi:hypothetical protein